MDIETWPDGLNYKPFRKGYAYEPGEVSTVTEMETGERDRVMIPYAPAVVTAVFDFSRAKAAVFTHWYHLDLEDGAKWFRMPVWTGTAWQDSLCQFIETWEPQTRGLRWQIATRFRARPFIVAE